MDLTHLLLALGQLYLTGALSSADKANFVDEEYLVCDIYFLESNNHVKKCRSSRPGCQSVGPRDHREYVCVERGRLSHPRGLRREYVFCKDTGYAPCWCSCPKQTYFHQDHRKCKRDKLDRATKRVQATKVNENDVIKMSNISASIPPQTTTPSKLLSSKLYATSSQSKYIKDEMPFPVWAITLIALIVVILGMLVILILY
ncbi:hypothetical protein CAPTEDRAFT_185479 [Capitella teleta]|uniref:EMI domain-containing protein n=1 Tax=Capitella teleta TaxID=283909 RepID=R7VD69_CAPTE|nr:hypothetical protein CAPTEDRAFT_185479 [Capitella teleta]|eukprot:ELU16517.1 hypothetical protein CAPTEDRAFT_185479 [Capitella teleta]